MHNTFDHCGLPSNQWTHTKGAFIIYLEGGGGGGYDDFEGGHSFCLLLFRGGCGKFKKKNDIEHRGANHFFPEKEKEMKMLLDTLIIPVFYFKMLSSYFNILILEYET